MLLLAISSLIVGLVLIGLHKTEERLGRGPLFAFVIVCQLSQNFLVSTVLVDLRGQLPSAPWSAVLYCASVSALLLVFLTRGLGATRRLVYGIALANIALALLMITTRWGLASGWLQGGDEALAIFRLFNLRAAVVGTILIMADAVLLLAIHEILRARVRWIPTAARIALSLLAVLCFDAVIFVTMGLGTDQHGLLTGNLVGKIIAGTVYSLLLSAFLARDKEAEANMLDTARIRDPLAMFTHRERLQLLEEEKSRSEANLRRLFESNVVGMFVATADGRIVSANDRFLEMTGWSNGGFPLPLANLSPPERRALDDARIREVVATGRAESWETEYLHRDAHRVHVLMAVTKMEGPEDRSLAVVVDLTQVKRAEAALRASEERYRFLFEEIPLMYFTLDPEGVVRAVNLQGAAELGYRPAELVGRPVTDLFHPSERSAVPARLQTALLDSSQVVRWESRKVRKDGSVLDVEETIRRVDRPPGGPELLVACQDVTARKEAEEKLQKHQRLLREAAWALTSIRERERRRIGRGLHDHVGQNLAMVQLKLGRLLEEGVGPETAVLASDARDLVVQTMQTTRSLSFSLASPILHELGLGAALKDLAERTSAHSGLEVTCACSGSANGLSEDGAAVLYRVTQELVHNAVKHAHAENLHVRLETRPDSTRITVEDDGRGFDASALDGEVSPDGGFGLLSVREQINQLGGRLVIQSRPGEGSRIEVSAPAEIRSPAESEA